MNRVVFWLVQVGLVSVGLVQVDRTGLRSSASLLGSSLDLPVSLDAPGTGQNEPGSSLSIPRTIKALPRSSSTLRSGITDLGASPFREGCFATTC
jgi:hypothetical protein